MIPAPRSVLRLAAAAWIVSAAAGLPAAPPAGPEGGTSPGIERRLEALTPADPEGYITLAEDLMDLAAAGDQGDRALARRLAALAGAIDPVGHGRGAALFLADHADSDGARARWMAIARSLGDDAAASQAAGSARSALALARAFDAYSRGEPARALEALSVPGAAELLDANPAVLSGGSARFRADCAAMNGRSAPPVSPSQLAALRAIAAASLAGGPRSWSEAIALGGDAPLPEVDLRDPRSLFGVDPAECLRRGGRWVGAGTGGGSRR